MVEPQNPRIPYHIIRPRSGETRKMKGSDSDIVKGPLVVFLLFSYFHHSMGHKMQKHMCLVRRRSNRGYFLVDLNFVSFLMTHDEHDAVRYESERRN